MPVAAAKLKATDARGRTGLRNRRVHVAVGEGTASIEQALAAFAAEWERWGATERGNARRLGAIEAENYHVLARRMKRRGASWSERGARHLARLLAARANGELDRYVRPAWRRRQALSTALAQPASLFGQRPSRTDLEDAAQWLRARIPALYGPHADREWVQALHRLAGFPVA